MRRRTFIAGLGSAAAWPLVARAQQADRIYRLAVIAALPRETPWIAAFFDELRLSGMIEGQNLQLVPGGFYRRYEELRAAIPGIVKVAPDTILCAGDIVARAVQEATNTLPLVAITDDMVEAGLVKSLAHPGGNMTGVSVLATDLDGKRQEFLLEAVPGARRIAALRDANVPARQLRDLQNSAYVHGVDLSILAVAKADEIAPAMDAAKASGAAALNVLSSQFTFFNRRLILERAEALRLPSMYQWPEMAEEGGFAAYGPRFFQVWRQAARIVVRVLRGAKPADIPVEQPTKFELVINLKTAKALDLDIPQTLLARADEVIE